MRRKITELFKSLKKYNRTEDKDLFSVIQQPVLRKVLTSGF